jgi:PKD repeat protein
MRVIFRALFTFLVILASSLSGYAQLSTIGKEFWVGFMENFRIFPTANNPNGAIDYAVLVITATEDTNGAIEYLGQSTAFELKSGEQYIFRKSSLDLDLLNRSSSNSEPLGIYITASGKISVHAFNERQASADGTVILPVSALGKDYLVTSYYEFRSTAANPTVNINRESTFLIVATEPNTRVEITTTVDALSGRELKGIPYEVELQRGESYQVKARGDLTGSRVRILGSNADDCKKIAVFGGNIFTSIGGCGVTTGDHLYQQAYPISTWGTSFVHTALLGRLSGELVKVLASEDNTEVRVDGDIQPQVLGRGEWMTLDFPPNKSVKIDTSKPSSVTVFSKSQSCNIDYVRDVSGLNGDPFMITYSPTEQFLTQLNFSTITLPLIQKHYLNIVVKAGEENNTRFDGNSIEAFGGMFESIYSGYKIARIEISEGVHSLSNPAGFTAYVYGFGNPESYGYAAGAALNNLNFETESDYDFNVNGEKVACLNQEADWNVNPENPDFTYFVWDFGDGTPTKIGKDVKHTYTKAGKYEVTIVASLSPNSCDEQEETTFEVLVVESKAEWEGPQSVCPDETIWYKVINKEAVARIDFEVVEGGEIIDRREDEVLVKWGASGDAILRMTPFTEDGCPGAPIDLPVEIKLRIVVAEALGKQEVCFDPDVPITYSVPNPLSSRSYEWEVQGGILFSGQGTEKIEIIWDREGITGTVGYTAFSRDNNSCAGTAPPIDVKVATQLTLATNLPILNVACFGEATGIIAMTPGGGTPPYTFEWSHDGTLNTEVASNLKAGFYSVKVTDALGCTQNIADIEVKEPPLLQLSNVTATPTTCFGKKDGRVRLEVIGGVGPYSLEFGGKQTFTGVFELDTLKKENYAWEVTDANGCKIPVTFEITSPPPLVVDVSLAKTACPGEANGELLVVPSGPAGPFQFLWNPSAQTTDLATSLAKGSYTVQVTDAAGCISFGTGIVIEEAPKIRMPNAFNPKEAPGKFTGVSNCVIDFSMIIYNRWGQLVYTGIEGWDGTFAGDIAPTGTYSYATTYSYLMEGNTIQVTFRGSVLLVR